VPQAAQDEPRLGDPTTGLGLDGQFDRVKTGPPVPGNRDLGQNRPAAAICIGILEDLRNKLLETARRFEPRCGPPL